MTKASCRRDSKSLCRIEGKERTTADTSHKRMNGEDKIERKINEVEQYGTEKREEKRKREEEGETRVK